MSKKLKIFFSVLVVVAIFFAFGKWGSPRIKNAIFSITSPLQRFLWASGEDSASLFGGLFEIKNLKKELTEFKEENLKLKQQLIRINEIEAENKRLREALGLDLDKKFFLALARPISGVKEGDFMVIDQGREDGFLTEMPVITSSNIFVGRIAECFDDFSQLALISNKEQTFSIKIRRDDEEILAVAKGQGNGRIKIELIPEEAEVGKGDVVLTSSLGGNLPDALLVGVIESIEQSAVEPFQEATLRPYFSEVSLKTLFLLKDF